MEQPQSPVSSQFAPATRKERPEVQEQYLAVLGDPHLTSIIESLPMVAAILNQERQVVYANHILLDMMRMENMTDLHPQRMGEILHCMHAHTEEGGCGTAEACRYCGAIQAVLEANKRQEKVEKDVRITTDDAQGSEAFDFWVSAVPYQVAGQKYSFVTISDISDQKRRANLERIFFHDIINTAGSLSEFLKILNSVEDPGSLQNALDQARQISQSLLDDILAQRQILAAERGELVLRYEVMDANELVEQVVHELGHHHVSRNREIHILSEKGTISLSTDRSLVHRTMINMLKNALEATKAGDTIRVGCYREKAKVVFWVHNSGFMPRKVQMQVFQRSFSTKGGGRGLGTYSMKLLGEQYLGGEVAFETDKTHGTTFKLTLPMWRI